jgi:hypothetical protein
MQPVAAVGQPAGVGPFSRYNTDAARPPLNLEFIVKVSSIVIAAAAVFVRVGCTYVPRRMRSLPRWRTEASPVTAVAVPLDDIAPLDDIVPLAVIPVPVGVPVPAPPTAPVVPDTGLPAELPLVPPTELAPADAVELAGPPPPQLNEKTAAHARKREHARTDRRWFMMKLLNVVPYVRRRRAAGAPRTRSPGQEAARDDRGP